MSQSRRSVALLLGLVGLAFAASSSDSAQMRWLAKTDLLDQSSQIAAPLAGGRGWTFQGCAALRPWTDCRDVYQDPDGNLWICSACGKTKNPNPSKCQRVSGSDLLWCS